MQQDFYRIRPATVADALAMAQVKQITWEATYRGIYPDAKLDRKNHQRARRRCLGGRV